jgi:hypothetical protein
MRNFEGKHSMTQTRDNQVAATGPTPGKRTLTEALPAAPSGAPAQRNAAATTPVPRDKPRPITTELFGDAQRPANAPERDTVAHPDWLTAALRPGVFSAPLQDMPASGASLVEGLAPVTQEGGTPLAEGVRRHMESSFGADLSDVRVHTDSSAATMGAAAFAQGNDIHFAPGRFDGDSESGRALLGHELAHVLQQRAGRVAGAQGKGDALNRDTSLEAEADDLGSRAARGEKVQVPGAPATASSARGASVRQGYILYTSGAGRYQYQTHGGATFTSQVTGGGASFMDPLAGAPRLQNTPAPSVRISSAGHLAIEDAQLTNRQPKFFYADAALVAGWNERLLAQGSFFELVPVPGDTLTFQAPAGGAARTLVKVEARNRVQGNQGINMTTAQRCDETVQEALGSRLHEPSPHFTNAPLGLPTNNTNTHRSLQQYYVAAELSDVAVGGGGVGVNTWGMGGMPNGGVHFGNPNPGLESVAQTYGTTMRNHRGAHNVALDNRMQQLGVNEYASPEVGQGIVTHKLGTTQPGGGGVGTQLTDNYNARVIANPNNNTVWGFHWAGVIAKDGADYITLENYARNAEDNLLQLSTTDPRFYFQMYGAGAQSWHEAWAATGHGGREFANPLTMVVESDETPAVFNERARRTFGGNIVAIRNDHNTLALAGSDDQLRIGMLKGLAYALDILDAEAWGDMGRVDAWKLAVTAVAGANPAVTGLRGHVLARLDEIWRTPVGGR